MILSRYKDLMRELGPYAFSKRMLRAASFRFYRSTPSILLSFKKLPYDYRLPSVKDLKVSLVTPKEAATLVDPQILIPAKILEDRFSQGAKMYGAWWQGRIVDYFWVAGAPEFRETTIGLTMSLKPNQFYGFDYKGIIKDRPAALSGFRLMKALVHYACTQESRDLETEAEHFMIVAADNRISMGFFQRIAKAKPVEEINFYRLLGICWSRRGKKC